MTQRGFALLIVLLTMGFLALLGTRLVAASRTDASLAGDLRQQAILEAAADGAVQHVVFALQAARDPAFQSDGLPRTLRIGQTPVEVRVQNESNRVDLNTAPIALLHALLIEVGATPPIADRLAGAILDWRTTGPAAHDGGPKAPPYQMAGLSYTPPGTPFKSVQELNDVLGMTPDLFRRLEPHVTVLTDADPDLSTNDPIVAQALADAAGIQGPITRLPHTTDDILRIVATATGAGGARYILMAVATGDFQQAAPRVNILLRQHLAAAPATGVAPRNSLRTGMNLPIVRKLPPA